MSGEGGYRRGMFWISLALLLLLPLGWLLLIFLVALCEKCYAKDYASVPSNRAYLTAYGVGMSDALEAAGFTHLAYGFNSKGIYELVASTWLSDDKSVLVIIVCGNIAKCEHRSTKLVSRVNGSYLTTSDMIGMSDLTGTLGLKILMDEDFDTLLVAHRERLADLESPRPWSSDGLAELGQIESDEMRAFVEKGLSYYLDEEKGIWRHSAKGAFHHILELRKKLSQAKPSGKNVGKGYQPRLIASPPPELCGDEENLYRPIVY